MTTDDIEMILLGFTASLLVLGIFYYLFPGMGRKAKKQIALLEIQNRILLQLMKKQGFTPEEINDLNRKSPDPGI